MSIILTAAIWAFLVGHQFVLALVGSWMFSAYASQLEAPKPMGNKFYSWWYTVVHSAAANLDRFRDRDR